MYTTILLEEQGAVARITLNRPDKRNPIGPALCGELVHALGAVGESPRLGCVLLGAAGKVFSAGGDLSGQGGAGAQVVPSTLPVLFQTMHGLGKPIVAMVQGHALAGGLGLVVACDLVVASEAAEFGTTEINLGLWPMMITAEIVRSVGRKKALELMLTGQRISAREAERIGLVNRVVAPEALEQEAVGLAQALAKKSPAVLRLGLRAFYDSQDMDHPAALAHLEGQLAAVLSTEDAAEGIAAFFAKREPQWKGR